MSQPDSSFSFDAFCSDNGLSDKTKQKLQDEDLTNPLVLGKLTDNNCVEMGLSVGQRIQLMTAVQSLSSSPGEKQVPSQSAAGRLDIRLQGASLASLPRLVHLVSVAVY